MKCPHCGKESRSKKACESCGKDLEPSQGMEVQYKDFKVSELLDIKLRTHLPSGKETPDTRPGQKMQKTEPYSGKKRPVRVKTIVLLAVAATAFFLLLRFIFRF